MWLSLTGPFFVCIWCVPGFGSPFATEDTKADGILVYRAGEPETQLCFKSFSLHHGCVERCLRLAFEELWLLEGMLTCMETSLSACTPEETIKMGTCYVTKLKRIKLSIQVKVLFCTLRLTMSDALTGTVSYLNPGWGAGLLVTQPYPVLTA